MRERRQFLKMLGAAAGGACLSGLGCSSSEGGVTEASGPVAAGNVKSLAVGALVPISGRRVLIARDERGLYAMTTICTHAQCDMQRDGEISAMGLSCDCHASEFDRNGGVLKAPATAPLRHWKVELDAATGDITILAGTVVEADLRVPVPKV